MFTRTALLLASAALFAAAHPALAHDDRYGPNSEEGEPIEWEQRDVVQQWDDETADAEGNSDAMREWHHGRRGHGEHRGQGRGHSPMQQHDTSPRLAYSLEQRDAWLADCRIVMRGEDYYYDNAYYDDAGYSDDDDDGGVLGGVIGAVVGGVAGNRIGGTGDRLAGTLIGAGIGGIAGAVIGSAIDDDDYDDYDTRYGRNAEEAYAADYCEAYLRRYEASGQTAQYSGGYGQIAYAQVQPVMLHAAPARHGGMREIIREEWVDVPAEPAEHHARRQIERRPAAPQRGKLTEVK